MNIYCVCPILYERMCVKVPGMKQTEARQRDSMHNEHKCKRAMLAATYKSSWRTRTTREKLTKTRFAPKNNEKNASSLLRITVIRGFCCGEVGYRKMAIPRATVWLDWNSHNNHVFVFTCLYFSGLPDASSHSLLFWQRSMHSHRTFTRLLLLL